MSILEATLKAGKAQKVDTDSITVLRSRGPAMTKTWRPDGSVDGSADGLWFTVEERAVSGILDLREVLAEIEQDPRACIIRGRLRGDWREVLAANLPAWDAERKARAAKDGKPAPDRLVQPHVDCVMRRKALFDDAPHNWLAIDVDEFRPIGDPVVDPEGALSEYIATLPGEFSDVSFAWQLSGSAGHTKNAGVLKAHGWFWLDAPLTSAQLAAWADATNAPVDRALYRTVQIHYCAAPVFAGGTVDPVPRRSGFADLSFLGGDSVPLRVPAAALAATDRDTNASVLVDPRTKPGLLGAFHRAFTVEQVVEQWVPDQFEWVSEHRLTWLGGNGAPEGAFARADRQGLGATHGTWPWGAGAAVNSWDLVRHFKFGHLDLLTDVLESAVLSSSAPHALPSHAAMREMVTALPEVQAQLPDGDPDKRVSAADIIERLRRMPQAEVLQTWIALSLPLSKGSCQGVIDSVAQLTGRGKNAMKGELADAREKADHARRLAATIARIGGRLGIAWEPDRKTDLAELLDAEIASKALPGEYVSFGGNLAQVSVKRLPHTHLIDSEGGEPPSVPQIEPLSSVAVLARAERVAAFYETSPQGSPRLIGVPQGVVDVVLEAKKSAAPVISGLVTHPIVLRDGTVLNDDGLHRGSGLFLQGSSVPGLRPYTQPEAAAALVRLRDRVLAGFEFATPLDADTALAGLFTGVERRAVDMAPGLCVVASTQASGKTTLARRVHVILSGRDMPVSAFAAGDEPEVRKGLLSLLMRSPAMVCFDNIVDGTTFRSGAVAAAMTGPVLTQRVLGETRDVDALTNVFFAMTGNNLGLGADETTRWLVSRLAPAGVKPEERVFASPDVVGHAMGIRAQVLRDVIGIVAGYAASGAAMPVRTRFTQWDRVVRQPLIWAGAADMADCFRTNNARSEDLMAHACLLRVLRDVFGDAPFKARDVTAIVGQRFDTFSAGADVPAAMRLILKGRSTDQAAELSAELQTALSSLRAKDPRSEASVGRVLKAKEGRVARIEIDGHEADVVLRSEVARDVLAYRVDARC